MNDRSLIKLHEKVWLFPNHSDPRKIEPAIGVVITPTGTILLDSGNGPKQAQALQDELKRLAAPPVHTVILTHHHWDHVFGTSHFNGTVIGHQSGFAHLKRYSETKWTREYIEELMQRNPASTLSQQAKLEAIDDFDSFRVKAPTITFTDQLTLHFEGITLQLKHIGGEHAADSIIIKVVEANIVFVGDAFYPPPASQNKAQTYSVEVLRKLIEESAELYVHGHGDPLTRDRIQRFITSSVKIK